MKNRQILINIIYTLCLKNRARNIILHNSRKCGQILYNSFTVAFSDEMPKNLEQHLPPHLKSIAALPCESWMFNSATLQHVIQCKCDAESFIYLFVYQRC